MIDHLLSKDVIPDFLIRKGIKSLLRQRLKEINIPNIEDKTSTLRHFIEGMENAPIALNTPDANEQHYEVPTDFYHYSLGPNKKYSCCLYETGNESLGEAENKMLQLTMKRAELYDGQDILELGCGWGSLTLAMAKKFPKSNITAVSNSATQKDFILSVCKINGYENVKIITQDMNDFKLDAKFDRVVSVEMFEHMRNYRALLGRVHKMLKDEGKLFIHIFVHREFPYLFEAKNDSDWMSKYFFTGGMMPSDDLLYNFTDMFKIGEHWRVNGNHYAKTARHWLENMDKNKVVITKLFKEHYGNEYKRWWSYWRIFFMSCEELWAFDNGNEWFVSHYLLEKEK
jgi:cyclopropane-fatty-acyl-phospholipid synthase